MSCRLSISGIDDMAAVILENDHLRIGILPGRGSDIYEFFYKPLKQDYLLRLSKGIRNPNRHFSQIRDTGSQFEDYYYGGWQVCLPNSQPFNYRWAALGQHGEVSLISWQYRIDEEGPETVAVTCTAEVLRLPLKIHRRFALHRGEAALHLSESVTNTGRSTLDIMWGQHIAFGAPFIEQGIQLHTNAKTLEAEQVMPALRWLKPGQKYNWPRASGTEGQPLDASRIPARGEGEYSELAYLEGYPQEAYYELRSAMAGFRLHWDGSLFQSLWMWQERNAVQDFPWWGDCYTLALEPWTARWTNQPEAAIRDGKWLRIEGGQAIQTKLTAEAFKVETTEAYDG